MQRSISTLICLIVLFTLSFCLFLPQSVARGKSLAEITVDAGNYLRDDTPVSLDLCGVPVGFPKDRLRLVEVKGSQRTEVPVQFEGGSPPRLW